MLHYVHQLVTDYISLLFDAGQVAYSVHQSLLVENSCVLPLETTLMTAVRLKPCSKQINHQKAAKKPLQS